MKDDRRVSEENISVKKERSIVVYMKAEKHEKKRGRKGDYLIENVTVDKKQRTDCAVFTLYLTSP